jgi:serine/threonine protein phosphatase PrpC
MNTREINEELDQEVFPVEGRFVLDTMKFLSAQAISVQQRERPESEVVLVNNGMDNRGNRSFDAYLMGDFFKGRPFMFPVTYREKEGDLPSMESITQGNILLQVDREANLVINSNGRKMQVIVADQPTVQILEKRAAKAKEIMQPETGKSAFFSGKMANGGPFAGLTQRSTPGSLVTKYKYFNEDSLGVNEQQGKFIVTDGIGKNGFGHLASHLVTSSFLENSGDLLQSANQAHANLAFYTHKIQSADAPNAVGVGGIIGDNYVDIFDIGDSFWMLIRDGKAVDMSEIRSEMNKLIQLPLDEYMVAMKYSHIVQSSFLHSFRPALRRVGLEKGDVLVAMSDGLDMLTDREICSCAKAEDPRDIAELMISSITAKNLKPDHRVVLSNQQVAHVQPPYDNATVFAYKH